MIIIPFGLSISLCEIWLTQRGSNMVLTGLDFVFFNLDGILNASTDDETHLPHLLQVFQKLKNYRLCINPAKSVLGVFTPPNFWATKFRRKVFSHFHRRLMQSEIFQSRNLSPVWEDFWKCSISKIDFSELCQTTAASHLNAQRIYKNIKVPLSWNEGTRNSFQAIK